ncbi:TPA: 2-oxo acid dehydrogenase subunit E2 [Candidatus Poribacteria bacterium]|nr:2-oxo acid dehydrogenase subunit E2 [Candidatus Poribacteria bacterium]HIO86457.1 2-oxo acid dehydrogenase subunit E2 [Candidatus Poseidoniales archaeon]
MAIEVTVPRLGWSMDEGVFVEWLKDDGDLVDSGDMLFILEGEKAAEEIESFDSGVLRLLPDGPKPGDVVLVGQVVGFLCEQDEVPPTSCGDMVAPAMASVADLVADPASKIQEPFRQPDVETVTQTSTPISSKREDRIVATPRARRAAEKLGIDLIALMGTGKGGRIREQDVLAAESSARSVMSTTGAGGVTGNLQPHTTIRQTIARRMVAGVTNVAPVTLHVKADATNLVALRNFLKEDSVDCPSYNDMIIKFCAVALQQHPMLNAQWRDEGIFIPDVINISLAVDTEVGLMVPVVRDVSSKSLDEIVTNSRQLIEASQNRQITAGQMEDGTFTVSNLGAFGIEYFTPIINLPQCAILGIGAIRQEPIMDGSEVVNKDQLPFSLTFDHRIVDGAPAAKFLQTLCQLIAQPRQSMLQKLYARALTT